MTEGHLETPEHFAHKHREESSHLNADELLIKENKVMGMLGIDREVMNKIKDSLNGVSEERFLDFVLRDGTGHYVNIQKDYVRWMRSKDPLDLAKVIVHFLSYEKAESIIRPEYKAMGREDRLKSNIIENKSKSREIRDYYEKNIGAALGR